MNVTYKCRCMAKEIEIAVPDRKDDEDVIHWVGVTVWTALFEDHKERSPLCLAEKVEYAMFEVGQGEGDIVGRMTKQ